MNPDSATLPPLGTHLAILEADERLHAEAKCNQWIADAERREHHFVFCFCQENQIIIPLIK
jgi:hypothetical protein